MIIRQIRRTIARLKNEGFTIVLVEADRHYVVEQGKVMDMIPNAERNANISTIEAYLGV